MLVLIPKLRDGRKIVLAVQSGYREATERWAARLRDLTARRLRTPRLLEHVHEAMVPPPLLADRREHGAHRAPDPQVPIGDDTLPKKLQAEARELLTKISWPGGPNLSVSAGTEEDADPHRLPPLARHECG